MVVSGELDLAAVADESELEGLRGHRLASLQAVAVFQDHTLTRLEQVEFAQLADADVIALNAEDASRKRLDALLRQSGQALRISIETPYSSTVCQLALAGHGVASPIRPRPWAWKRPGWLSGRWPRRCISRCHMILHGSRPLGGRQILGDLPARRAGALDERYGVWRLAARAGGARASRREYVCTPSRAGPPDSAAPAV